jgi:hypothetical protein
LAGAHAAGSFGRGRSARCAATSKVAAASSSTSLEVMPPFLTTARRAQLRAERVYSADWNVF